MANLMRFVALQLFHARLVDSRIWAHVYHPTYTRMHRRVAKHGWCFYWAGGDYEFVRGDVRLIQPNEGVLCEDLDCDYHVFDYRGKTVLDVGGYFGETAVLSKSWGARWVDVVEPIPLHAYYARVNMQRNAVKGRLLLWAVAGDMGELDIYTDGREGHPELGHFPGNVRVRTRAVTWEHLLLMRKYDIVKSDCEGAERWIVDVPPILLPPFWVIEVHTRDALGKLEDYFPRNGFEVLVKPKKRTWHLIARRVHF